MNHRVDLSQSGFSLVEALVSLAIIGMACVLVVTGLGGARLIWGHFGAGSQSMDNIESAQSILRQHLEAAIPSTRYEPGQVYVDFDGSPTRLRFIAPPGASDGAGAPRLYSLAITTDGTVTLSDMADTRRDGASWRPRHALLTGVQSMEIAYYGASAPGQPQRWQNTWHKSSRPPLLVRIRVRFPPWDRRWWPDFLVHPQADVDTDCALGGTANRCRGR